MTTTSNRPAPITREAATIGARVMVAGNDEPATIIEADREGWYVVRLWHRGRHVGDVVKALEEMTPA